MSELREKIADILKQPIIGLRHIEGNRFLSEADVQSLRDAILAVVAEAFERAITGQYPQGNSYADQMERVLGLIEELRLKSQGKEGSK